MVVLVLLDRAMVVEVVALMRLVHLRLAAVEEDMVDQQLLVELVPSATADLEL